MRKQDRIHIVLKMTEVCNLGCKYCYFFEGGDVSYKADPPYITHEMVESIGAFLSFGAKEMQLSTVEVTFHGGEPLMIGKRRFREICDILHRHVDPHAELLLTLQTNATLLDGEWIEILSLYKVGVGISLDGPEHINDAFRIDKRGKGTHKDVLRGIAALDRGTAQGLNSGFGVICVVQPDTEAVESLEHFVKILGEGIVDFRPPMMDWTNFDHQLVASTTRYYKDLVCAWIKRDNAALRLKFPSFVLAALLSDVGAQSSAHVLLNRTRSISIRSNGDLCPDDALVPKDIRYRHTGFNVASSAMSDFLSAPFWSNIDVPNATAHPECVDCRWLGICRGGPVEERYLGNLEFSSKTVYCSMRKVVFETIYELVSSVIGRDAVDQRLEDARRADQSHRLVESIEPPLPTSTQITSVF